MVLMKTILVVSRLFTLHSVGSQYFSIVLQSKTSLLLYIYIFCSLNWNTWIILFKHSDSFFLLKRDAKPSSKWNVLFLQGDALRCLAPLGHTIGDVQLCLIKNRTLLASKHTCHLWQHPLPFPLWLVPFSEWECLEWFPGSNHSGYWAF